MSLHVIFAVLVCVYSAHSWNLDVSGRLPNIQNQQLRSVTPVRPQCFGLARRTRQVKASVPVFYNFRTGQTAPVPRFLHAADDNAVTRMENDGWEIRKKSIFIPQQVYERVPVCCPWDRNCYQGRQAIPVLTPDAFGPCANGGQLIYRDGQQKCECHPAFKGNWCQIRRTPGDDQLNNFPSGPLIRMLPLPSPYMAALRDAEVRRPRIVQSPALPVMSLGDPPISPALAYRAAMLKKQIMKAKIAQYKGMNRQGQAGDFYNQRLPKGMPSYDARRNMNAWRSSPLSARAGKTFTPMQGAEQNPYSALSYQGQLPPYMARAFSAVQESLQQRPPVNSYSRSTQAASRPLPLVLTSRRQGGQNPYNRLPHAMDVPQARTPWDLDPFGQQQNPSYMNYPGMPGVPNINKQAMAIALYQQMLKQQRGSDSLGRSPMNVPSVVKSGPATPVGKDSQPRPLLTSAAQVDSSQSGQGSGINTPNGSPSDGQQSPPTNSRPDTPRVGDIGQQDQPRSENVDQIEQCQAILTPKLNACLQDYQLTMEQFMTPEYMQKARVVCEASEAVGQCVRQHDKACGEGDTIMTTRKMLVSVLQMMGMVCQQIAARGELPSGPLQVPQSQPELLLRGAPIPDIQRVPPAQTVFANEPLSTNEVQEPPMIKEETKKQESAASPHAQPPKSSYLNSEKVNSVDVVASASKSDMGHDSAHPINKELQLFGYPLWLVVSLGLALFLALFLFVVVLCLCCRRRCRQKKVEITKVIEKVPVPLDSKLCTIDLPPPSYNTTVVSQNDDSFNLPPLDVDSKSLNSEYSINEKSPASDDDSDKETEQKKK